MLRKTIVAALLLVLPAAARAQSAAPDMRDYQSLLDRYLHRISAHGAPVDTRFDYEQLYVDERIRSQLRSARLARMHEQLLSVRPSAMTPAERLAWGINTYNFLIIQRVTDHLLIPGVKILRYKRVDQIDTFDGGFFVAYVANVEGRPYTLDGFQRRFVFGDTTQGTGPRPPLRDPRLLFATNPGRIGAPPLQPRAYRADSLERQLDEATRTALALPRFVTVRENPPLLLVSNWLGSNLRDFGDSVPKLLAFIQKYAPREVREGMKRAKFTEMSRFMDVNPLLNQKDHDKLIMPAPAASDTVGS